MVDAIYSSSVSLVFFLAGSSDSSFSSSFLRFLGFSVKWHQIAKKWLGIAGEVKKDSVVGVPRQGIAPRCLLNHKFVFRVGNCEMCKLKESYLRALQPSLP